jgi:prepilin-type N-terminal cleavage/methylation domain-containing protein
MNKSNKKIKMGSYYSLQSGMTYVELIVVLSIFAVMSSIVIFNYGGFQANVDIKNLASNIALKIVEAQNSSLSGLQQTGALPSWKPAYGVYFNKQTSPSSFIYFADLNDNGLYDGAGCGGECLNQISITKNNVISNLNVFYQDGTNACATTCPADLTVSFKRPDSGAVLYSGVAKLLAVSYIQITIASPRSAAAIGLIKVYPSGRVQVN